MVFDDSIHFTSVSMALTLLEEVLFSSMGDEEAACFRRMTEVCANSSSWGSTKPWPSQSFLPAAAELADSEVQASWRLSLFKQWCHNFLIPLLSSCICSPNDSPSLFDLGHFSCSLLLSRCFPRCPWLSPLCVGLLLSYPPLLLTFFFFLSPWLYLAVLWKNSILEAFIIWSHSVPVLCKEPWATAFVQIVVGQCLTFQLPRWHQLGLTSGASGDFFFLIKKQIHGISCCSLV